MKPLRRWNLLPRGLAEARACRIRRHRWMMALAAYTGALSVVCGSMWMITQPGLASASTELAELTQRNRESSQSIDAFERQFKTINDALEHRQNLSEQPDFSVLLKLIARSVDSSTVLRQLSLRGSGSDKLRATPAPSGSDREPRYFVLLIQGTSAGENGVTHFSSKLAAAGLFDRVELRRTGRDLAGPGGGVAFELECFISEPAGRGPSSVPISQGRVP